jgi:serine O-acetyltransferase
MRSRIHNFKGVHHVGAAEPVYTETMGVLSCIVRFRRVPILGRVLRHVGYLYGFDFPASIQVGRGLSIQHRGTGTVLHPYCVIGNDVVIYHNVTVGRKRLDGSPTGRTFIGDFSILCAGAVIATGSDDLYIGEGAVIGANTVITRNVGSWEVWAGNPARKISDRNWGLPASRQATS